MRKGIISLFLVMFMAVCLTGMAFAQELTEEDFAEVPAETSFEDFGEGEEASSISSDRIEYSMEELNVATIPELYTLRRDRLLGLEGFKEKKAQNLLTALENSKHRPLSAFLNALGIPNVGVKTARDLSLTFGSLDKLRSATYEELVAIEDVGEVVAQSVLSFFHDPRISQQIDDLIAYGVSPVADRAATASPISGKTIVITGTLPTLSRKEAEDLIMGLGGPEKPGQHGRTIAEAPGKDAVDIITQIRDLCEEFLLKVDKGDEEEEKPGEKETAPEDAQADEE